jgi:hypothetical protein
LWYSGWSKEATCSSPVRGLSSTLEPSCLFPDQVNNNYIYSVSNTVIIEEDYHFVEFLLKEIVLQTIIVDNINFSKNYSSVLGHPVQSYKMLQMSLLLCVFNIVTTVDLTLYSFE